MENQAQEPQNEVKKKVRKKPIRAFFADFKTFMSKGNVLNLAVAFVMGAAFNAIITSLANDLIMPIIGLFLGKSNIEEWVWTMGTASFYYGKFLFAVVNFIIIAFTLFIIIKLVTGAENNLNKLKKRAKLQRKLFEKGLVETPELEAPAPEEAPAPLETTDDILKDIRRLLQLNQQALIVANQITEPLKVASEETDEAEKVQEIK